jgi:hypothetical protein
MGIFDGISSKLKSAVAPAASAISHAASTARTEVTKTAARLETAAQSFAKPLSSPVPVPKAMQSALGSVRSFVVYAIPSFGSKPAPPLVDTRSRFTTPVRGANEIRKSGALQEFAKLKGVKVPTSELNRNIEDDAVLVRQGLAKMTPEQIADLKNKAYENPEVKQDLAESKKRGYYGSAQHKQYGATVEFLTGGVISAEEAMAMNPSGGLPGPGMKEIPLANDISPVARHAMRHDANGFLMTRFGIGPGYGSKTTPFGLHSDSPFAGQYLGVIREAAQPTKLPSSDHVVGAPVR